MNVSNLTDSDYLLTLNAGVYTVTRLSDNAVISSFAAPVAPATVAIGDGLTLNIAANAVNGDSFVLAPTRGAGGEMRRVLDDVRGVAAALPVNTRTATSNTGSGIVKSVQVTDTTTAAFATPLFLIHEGYLDGHIMPPGVANKHWTVDDDGHATLPEGVGLGVEIDESKMAEVAADPNRKFKWPHPTYEDGSVRDY